MMHAVFAHDPPAVGGEDGDDGQREEFIPFAPRLEDVVEIVELEEEIAESVWVGVPIVGQTS